ALQQVRNAAGELDHLEAALDVALGVRERLAVLGREQRREAVVFGLHELEELEHDAGAPLRIGGRPGRLRGRRIGDRRLDLGFRRESDPRLHLTGVGIEDVAGASRFALDLVTTDEMANLAHHALHVLSVLPAATFWPFVPSRVRALDSPAGGAREGASLRYCRHSRNVNLYEALPLLKCGGARVRDPRAAVGR